LTNAGPEASSSPIAPTIPQGGDADDIEESNIDDAAVVFDKGFLRGRIHLPTYQPKGVHPGYSKPSYVTLTISDVLRTISQECDLARRVLFETARLQRPLLSVGPLRLSQNARVLDKELVKLDKVLGKGDELIEHGWSVESVKEQLLTLQAEPFQKALRMYFASLYLVIPVHLSSSLGL
jgi:hypothetical protein